MCQEHSQCVDPGEQKVMDIQHTMPCFECEKIIMAEDGINLEFLQPLHARKSQLRMSQ